MDLEVALEGGADVAHRLACRVRIVVVKHVRLVVHGQDRQRADHVVELTQAVLKVERVPMSELIQFNRTNVQENKISKVDGLSTLASRTKFIFSIVLICKRSRKHRFLFWYRVNPNLNFREHFQAG